MNELDQLYVKWADALLERWTTEAYSGLIE